MKGLVILLCITYAIAQELKSRSHYRLKKSKAYYEKNIYWRTWNDKSFPKDAFIGGWTSQDCGSAAAYVVQGFEPTLPGILPSQMYLPSTYAETASANKSFWTYEYIWVLCTKDQNVLTWISHSDINDLDINMDEYCIPAGHENTFFGRYHLDDPETTIVGAVFRDNKNQLTFRSHEGKILTPFEVLCYNG